MRRIDIDSITFDSGSWEVGPEQQPKLQALAEAMQQILSQRPDEIFLIEGHTDAVGADVDNLSLSDRRAESVAVVLTSVYQVPPENLAAATASSSSRCRPTDRAARTAAWPGVITRCSTRRSSRSIGLRGGRIVARPASLTFRTAACWRSLRRRPGLELRPDDARVHLLRAGEGGKPQSPPATTFSRPTTLA
jgi:hypothetical protein